MPFSKRIEQILEWSFSAPKWRAVLLSFVTSLIFAPASNKFLTIISDPDSTAKWRGVIRLLSITREWMLTLMDKRKRTDSMSPFCIATWRKFLPFPSCLSAAVGSRSRIALAALLFLNDIAVANGVEPNLSLVFKSRLGWDKRSLMTFGFWLMMATWRGVFPSASFALTSAPNSRRDWTTLSRPQVHAKWRGVCPSKASSSPSPEGEGLRGESTSHPDRIRKQAISSLFSSKALWRRVCQQFPGPGPQQLVSQLYWTRTEATSSSSDSRAVQSKGVPSSSRVSNSAPLEQSSLTTCSSLFLTANWRGVSLLGVLTLESEP